METGPSADKLAIRELVDPWIIAGDAGPSGSVHRGLARGRDDDGDLVSGQCAGVRRGAAEGGRGGVSVIHANLGHISEIRGAQAIAQTRMAIGQPAALLGLLADVVVTGRLHDLLAKKGG